MLFSQTFTYAGGAGGVTLSLSGTLPTGLSFDTRTGRLSGTPTQTGTYTFTLVATRNAGGCSRAITYTVVVP